MLRKHPDHGIFYHNWQSADLLDGDILLVRGHDEFFTVANEGARQLHKVSSQSLACQDGSSDGASSENAGMRNRVWRFITDPVSSWCVSLRLV